MRILGAPILGTPILGTPILGTPILATLFVVLLLTGRQAAAQSCTVSSTTAAFGTYQPLAGAADYATATITVVCNPGTLSVNISYTLQLTKGGGTSFATRAMTGTATPLSYQLYRDVGYSQIWGDGTGGSYSVTDGYLLGLILPVTKVYTAYGKIPGSQNIAVGSYGDLVTAMITY